MLSEVRSELNNVPQYLDQGPSGGSNG
jgi:hypothetical protein